MKSYISMLFLALLLFPMVEKALHDFSHLNDKHCEIKETHFCQAEHSCDICDYLFSSSTTPPKDLSQIKIFVQISDYAFEKFTSNTTTSPKYTFPLRGPPVC